MTDFYRVLITASRDWDDPGAVYTELDLLLIEHGSLTVVHGDCPTGGDLNARQWAEMRIIEGMRSARAYVRHEPYPAEWNLLGKSAGPIRNAYMVNLGADECVAFPLAQSRGTIGCMKLAAAAGIPVRNMGWQGAVI